MLREVIKKTLKHCFFNYAEKLPALIMADMKLCIDLLLAKKRTIPSQDAIQEIRGKIS